MYLFCIQIDFFGILNEFGHISGQISLTWPAEILYFFKLVIFFSDFQKKKNMEPAEIKLE